MSRRADKARPNRVRIFYRGGAVMEIRCKAFKVTATGERDHVGPLGGPKSAPTPHRPDRDHRGVGPAGGLVNQKGIEL